MMLTGAHILLRTLKSRGTKHIFGIVGREAEAIAFNEVKGVEFMLTRDERSAAFMADIQGRLTGKIGVCYSTFGPGATNLATGIASAYLDRAPMLAISAQVESLSIHPSTHQYVDQVALMRPITKYAKEVSSVSELQLEILRAATIAESGIPGPCFLSIPLDIFRAKTGFRPLPDGGIALAGKDSRVYTRPAGFSGIKDLLTLIRQSKDPICIVGSAVRSAAEVTQLQKLLRRLRIPVVTTYGGKGVIPPESPYYLGTVSKYLDCFIPGTLKKIFEDTDCILLAGFDMVEGITPELWRFGREKKVCAINSIVEDSFAFIPVDAHISMAYRTFSERLTGKSWEAPRDLKITAKLKKELLEYREDTFGKRSGLTPFAIVNVLNEELSAQDILISDVGLHKQYVSLYYEAKKPKSFFCSNGLGSMGFGLPAALGAKRACPERNVVAVCGDAGFHLSSPELETSVRNKLPVVCVVFCDNSVGLIRHYQKKGLGGHNPAITDFGKVDFVRLAQANGAVGCRVSGEDEFRKALRKALSAQVTNVLEVPLNRDTYVC
ncbi:MAG: thiamine pyrophosphate-dependent enzyme [Candidatus Omnitrophota bacterium]